MIRPATLGLLSALALATPGIASAAPTREVAAQVTTAPAAPAKATTEDTSSYAQREQQDKKVANYEGGSFVVIGISGTALLVVFLVLLLV